jgi:hypothetical protein
MSLKHLVPRLGGLSSAAVAVIVGGRIGFWLVGGLLALGFVLVAFLALTGTFACDKTREAAQIVLAILLGRNRPEVADGTPPKSAIDSLPGGSRPRP